MKEETVFSNLALLFVSALFLQDMVSPKTIPNGTCPTEPKHVSVKVG